MKKQILLTLLLIALGLHTYAQPAQYFFGATGKDEIMRMIPTTDGNLLAVGTKKEALIQKIWLLKIATDGALIWEKTFTATLGNKSAFGAGLTILPSGEIVIVGEEETGEIAYPRRAIVIKSDADGNQIWKRKYDNVDGLFDAELGNDNILLVGWIDDTGASNSGCVMAINANGEQQWLKSINVYSENKVRRILPTDDGNFILVGRANVIGAGFQGIFLTKITPNGTSIWQKTHTTDWREPYIPSSGESPKTPLGAVIVDDGSIWVTNPNGYNPDITLLHYSSEGELIAQKNYGSSNDREHPYGLTQLPDGGWLIVGASSKVVSGSGSNSIIEASGFAMQIDSNGLEVWRYYYGEDQTTENLYSGVLLNDEYIVLAGSSNSSAGNGDNDGWLLRVELDGNSLPWTIEGQIVIDLNNNCLADADEPVAKGWFVDVSDTLTRTVVSDNQGKFKIRIADGSRTLTVHTPTLSDNWQFCDNNIIINSDNNNPTAQVTFLVQSADGNCPRTEVGITQPNLVRCSTSTFIVTVKNNGSGGSEAQLLSVTAEPALTIISASEPYFQNGNSIEFEIPPMGVFEQKSIAIDAQLSCDVQIGATHAMVARITPVECANDWNGPRFTIEGNCVDNNVVFLLKNEGTGGANASTRLRVISDGFLHTDWTPVDLPEGGTPVSLSYLAHGMTWRVEMEQVPGFASLSNPALSIEGCGVTNNGLHSIQFRNAWRYDDGTPEVAAVLTQNTTGVPNKVAEALKGLSTYNLVDTTQWLEYTARLVNPFSVDVEKVEFRFNFSPNFDIRTFQIVASNVPVELSLDNNNILKAIMSNTSIDSGAYAMLRFRVRPFANTPADSAQVSSFLINAQGYLNGQGPYLLFSGSNNLTNTIPIETDEYNNYPPEILLYGGENTDFGLFATAGMDGSVFLTGETRSYSERTNSDGLIIKTNQQGKAIWLNAIDFGDQGANSFRSAIPLSDGGCIVIGNYRPPGADNYLSSYSAAAARISANGQLLWHKIIRPYGPEFGAWASGGIPVNNDGQFIIFGYTLTGATNRDHFYIKMNENGDIIWQQAPQIIGSAFSPSSAITTIDGGVVFFGENESAVANQKVYIEKIDANGNILWNAAYNSAHSIRLGNVAAAPDGGFLLSGYSQWEVLPGDFRTTPTFMKFTSEGVLQWEKNPIVGPFGYTRVLGSLAAPGGGYYAFGEVYADTLNRFSDVLLMKIDHNADTIWTRNYGAKNTEWANSATISASTQVLLFGNNQSRPPLYNLQTILVCTDLYGNLSVATPPEPIAPKPMVMVSPNPAYQHFHVSIQQFTTDQPLHWQIIDPRGVVQRTGLATANEFDINVSNLPGGMYFLTFQNQNIPNKRIVIR